jgi:5'-nucleotidase
MRILLTNDDGYRALGIQKVYTALVEAGHEVMIVAPELNSSGAGQSILVYMPMRITQVTNNMYFVDSTPADSVRMGLQLVYNYPDGRPDLIIAGINMGENIAEDTLYSGTVGAAREGFMHGIPSIAFSTPGPNYDNLDSGARVVVDLVERLVNNPKVMHKPFVWNVNIPNKPYGLITGYETTEFGLRELHKPMDKQFTPRGEEIYWQGAPGDNGNPALGTDIDVVVKQEKVSITPMKILATDYDQMAVITALTL